MKNIVLIGLRGSGKTTIGILLSEKLKRKLIETDREIEKIAGKNISRLVNDSGWEKFRDIETEIIRSASGKTGCIIATGGGAVLRSQNMDDLKKNGYVIWLDAPVNILTERTGTGSNRPRLTGKIRLIEEMKEIKAVRRKLYATAADCKVNTAGPAPEETAREIIRLIKLEKLI